LNDFKLTSDGGYILCGYVIGGGPVLNDLLVIKVDSNGCDTASCTVGIDENISTKKMVTLYPNPTNGLFTISIDAVHLTNSSVTIFDNTGQLIYNQKINDNEIHLDLSSYSKGIYFYHLINDNQSYSGKLLLQ
jgi:hypothetical protein